ncbi:MAG TPA: hypothetical protein V6D22_11505 [Candidatus Obscuribacterales bacterium]
MSLGERLGKKGTRGPEGTKSAPPSRVRLTWINGTPRLNETRVLLAEAQKNRGILCELPIRSDIGIFLLTCQADHLSSEPCWTLYEGEDAAKQVWTYLTENVDMINDIVSMSVLNRDAKTQVDLPPGPGASPKATAATPVAAAPAEPTPAPLPAPAPAPEPYVPPSSPAADPFTAAAQASTWPAAQSTPTWGAPGGVQAQSMPGWGQAAGAQPTDWPAAQPQAGWGNSNQPFAQPQPFNGGYTPAQPLAASQPYPSSQPSDSPWKTAAAPADPTSSASELSAFASSLDAKKGTTIAELAMSPTLPAACVDAALKLQEMVLTGHFGENVALVALKYAALNNGELTDTVLTRAKGEFSSDPNEAVRKASALLTTAGVFKESDVAAAEQQLEKHNNSLSEALVSSGKVDKLLLEAAQDCLPLIDDAKLRQDQAIIALLYCQRSRAKLKDALDELSIEI